MGVKTMKSKLLFDVLQYALATPMVRIHPAPYFNQQSWCEMSGILKHTMQLKSIKFLLHYIHLKNLILLCKNWH